MVHKKEKPAYCPEPIDCHGYTPLIGACFNGNTEWIINLLNNDYNPNSKGNSNVSPLSAAVCSNNSNRKQAVTLLMKVKADVDPEASDGTTPLLIASDCGYYDIVDILLHNKANVNKRNKEGQTPLWIASKRGNLDIVKKLYKFKADINCKLEDGMTALVIASLRGRLSVVEFLLNKGAAVNMVTDIGSTALHAACENKYLEIVKKLLAKHAKIDSQDKDGRTPLMIAAHKGFYIIVEQLISSRANINIGNNDKETALHLAAAGGYRKTAALLLKSYPEVKRNKYGQFPSNVARSHGKASLAVQLELYENDQQETQHDWISVTRVGRKLESKRFSFKLPETREDVFVSVDIVDNSSPLTIQECQLTDTGDYMFTAQNGHRSDTASTVVIVEPSDIGEDNSSLTKQELRSTDAEDYTVTVQNDQDSNTTSTHVNVEPRDRLVSVDIGEDSSPLAIQRCPLTDTGDYAVTTQNDHGSETATTHLIVEPRDVLVPADIGEDNSSLTIQELRSTDAQDYTVTVQNDHDSDTASIEVYVEPKVSALIDPVPTNPAELTASYLEGPDASVVGKFNRQDIEKAQGNNKEKKNQKQQQNIQTCQAAAVQVFSLFQDIFPRTPSALQKCIEQIRRKRQIFRDIMLPDPVIDYLFTRQWITRAQKSNLAAIGQNQGIDRQIESLMDELFGTHVQTWAFIASFKESLMDSDYHTNLTLSRMIPGSDGVPLIDPVELLTKEEYNHILNNFYKNFIDYVDVKDISDGLRPLRILHQSHRGTISNYGNQTYDAAKYLLDMILLRGTIETVEGFRKVLLNSEKQSQHRIAYHLPQR